MKKFFVIALLAVFSACSMSQVESRNVSENPVSEVPNAKSKTPVLVELFTSEG